MDNIKSATKKLALMSMLLALITVLSFLEHMLPPLPFLPPNVRLGLSNIVTMYALIFLGKSSAVTLTVLKAVFAAVMRGVTAGILSLSGGMLSIIILLIAVRAGNLSYLILGILGAIGHNLGQIITASFILGTNLILPYLPVLLVSGTVLGSITGSLLGVVMPYFNKVFHQ